MSQKIGAPSWDQFCRWYMEFPQIGLGMDLSRMNLNDNFIGQIEPRLSKAFVAMKELEAGAISNPDENRMVGHYWLRNAALAPTGEIQQAIDQTLAGIKTFAAKVHAGDILGTGGLFEHFLIIGIGGSALGPQFVSHALMQPRNDKMMPWFIDNTDPDGIDQIKAELADLLEKTLVIVISKSGGTKETRNGMLEIQSAFKEAKLDFANHAVAITGKESDLDKVAQAEGWIQRFPMWDWVGGRTSVTSAVGLLPAALQGFDIDQLLAGAAACDTMTRTDSLGGNPAVQLAAAWFCAVDGRGAKDMVILPYKDRLALFPKYLQQLIMESLGKEHDLDGKVVNQGITVYGNKGSTDQHAYIQQLRDGVHNFFATFIRVLKDQNGTSIEVEKGIYTGDYLDGFYQGTRDAIYENDRQSITVVMDEINAFSVGVLIALYERAVGYYSLMININAYNQPGVEAGKNAAGVILELQSKIIVFLNENSEIAHTVEAIANGIDAAEEKEKVFLICQHLSAQVVRGIRKTSSNSLDSVTFQSV
ncbi:MAG: glucose-6-phosphate isomerase [Verrucomicrobiota bacterium]|nr:glucose-6-phosphate isomerase [Verrucomicrobiota bacterium]